MNSTDPSSSALPEFTPTILAGLRKFRQVFRGIYDEVAILEGDFWNYLGGYLAAEELEAKPKLLVDVRRYVDRNRMRNHTCAVEIGRRLDSVDPMGEVLTMLRAGNQQLALSGFPWSVFERDDEWKNLTRVSRYLCPQFLYDPNQLLPDGRTQDEA